MAYTDIADPSAYFQNLLWTGNGSNRSLTFNGNSDLQPNWSWIKQRSGSNYHTLTDSVRGLNKQLYSNANDAEATQTTNITAYGSDGVSLGTDGNVNANSSTYVGWFWKAGTSFTNNAGANGANLATTAGSVNTDAGFSILKWNSSGMAGEGLLAHGLGVVPSVIMIKSTSASDDWYTYHKDIGATKYVRLNQTAAETSSTWLENKTPTSALISLDNGFWGTSSIDYICYCFAEKQGYSKFSSYVGNGSDTPNGIFIYLGFKPAFILIKATDSNSWVIVDNKRPADSNPVDSSLAADSTAAETTADNNTTFDFLSNGFKTNGNSGNNNSSGQKYIFMAFAESPFTTSTGVPAPAR